ncbi:MAG: hypothetical protein R2911_00960 [Caldilineaceae bacterium]
MQAQGNNTNYVQYNFGTAANPATATFDARFYFNPNGNTGNNQDILPAQPVGPRYSACAIAGMAARRKCRSKWVRVLATQHGPIGITNSSSNVIEVVWQSGGST